jgi:arabinose-5-phosphate isomerase
MKARDFKKSDFASFHPGGALGKQLFVKVSDLMQIKNLPIINKDS